MLSGVGPASVLEKVGVPVVAHRPGVGQNLCVSMIRNPVELSADHMVIRIISTQKLSFQSTLGLSVLCKIRLRWQRKLNDS